MKSTGHPCIDSEPLDALDAIKQGYLRLDEDLVVRRYNRAYRQLLEIEDDRFIDRPYSELLKFLLDRGELIEADAHEKFLAERLRAMQNHEPLHLERIRPNGTVLSVSATPLPSGGYVYTYLDITSESRALEEVQRNAKATVVAMANFAEHRDTDTGVHVLRVARLVGQIARKLKRRGQFPTIIDDAYIERIATASILHDVGKISTPDRILLKAGPLSDEERRAIMLHAAEGAHLLKQAYLMMDESAYLQLGSEIALTHHEWFDGNGYPSGLVGEDIPLAGRICAIADVFDALTSHDRRARP